MFKGPHMFQYQDTLSPSGQIGTDVKYNQSQKKVCWSHTGYHSSGQDDEDCKASTLIWGQVKQDPPKIKCTKDLLAALHSASVLHYCKQVRAIYLSGAEI